LVKGECLTATNLSPLLLASKQPAADPKGSIAPLPKKTEEAKKAKTDAESQEEKIVNDVAKSLEKMEVQNLIYSLQARFTYVDIVKHISREIA